MAGLTTSYYTLNGEILSESTGGVRLDYLTDALGSVTATLDQTTAATHRMRYKPYGANLVGPTLKVGWCGTHGYRGTGLRTVNDFYVRARHYASKMGQWTTRDPHWPRERAFAYCRVNPTVERDPSGLDPDQQVGTGAEDVCKVCKTMSDADLCVMIRNMVGDTNPGDKLVDNDFAACCYGRCVPCIGLTHMSIILKAGPTIANKIKACIEAHENTHCNHSSLLRSHHTYCGDPRSCTPANCGTICQDKLYPDECAAFEAQIACMLKAFGNDLCKDRNVCDIMCDICKQGNTCPGLGGKNNSIMVEICKKCK